VIIGTRTVCGGDASIIKLDCHGVRVVLAAIDIGADGLTTANGSTDCTALVVGLPSVM